MRQEKAILHLLGGAIKIQSKLELISEEMRVLYVALTRAKEKLIITGMTKDYKKEIEKKEELLQAYQDGEERKKINKSIVQKYLSYLDWMELVYLARKNELEGWLDIAVHNKREVLKQVLVREEDQERDYYEELKNIDREEMQTIKEKLEWEYMYKTPENILTKTSVTKIKRMKIDLKEEEEAEYKVPEFLRLEKALTNAEKGTIMHLILQKLNEKVEYNKNKLEELLSDLEDRQIIRKEEGKSVDIEKVLLFTKTKIWNELKTAKEVHKEKPFYINIPAKEVYEGEIDENILVQGIIDLYYITEAGEIVLVDYKTDRVKKGQELISKYEEQLRIYKNALEKSIRQKS